MAQRRSAPPLLAPEEHLEDFALVYAGADEIRLVCDTNVYLNAREAIGVVEDGRLRIPLGPSNESPDVTLLRAPSLAGIPVTFILAVPVINELFSLIRDGYAERPVGLGDARRTAVAVRNLMSLHELGKVERGGRTVAANLPDPPLSADEHNDRHIWFQAEHSRAILVTWDGNLVAAVRQQTGRPLAALRPVELIEIAVAFVKAAGLTPD